MKPAPPCVGVACSGGRDSMALLHVTLEQAKALGLRVVALHVHHGLQPQADEWLRHVEQLCSQWKAEGRPVEFRAHRLQGSPTGGESVEAWARRGRYEALGAMAREAGACLVLLAHHRRDQAETFVLQALRGGGAAGLSAMPRLVVRDGIAWGRPWLELPRNAIEAYMELHGLRHVDDPSNEAERHARNRLRVQVWPGLIRGFPDAEVALGMAAERAQEEARCLQELAALDLSGMVDGEALDLRAWASLSSARRANALRAWYRGRSGRGAPQTLIARLLEELTSANGPSHWPADGGELRCYRDRLEWHAGAPRIRSVHEDSAQSFCCSEPGIYRLSRWEGALQVDVVSEGGVARRWLERGGELRARVGGERFQRHPKGIPRSLKKEYQAAGIAAWQRDGPLLYCDGQLVFVPGLGIDARAVAPRDEPQFGLRWRSDG
ncbi:MAG TPA: tRNA lysidine(34) synthetase TilS [Burkholderiaceae bacterium]|nr:tRNA lysidine(34) synthetase TilS [Burkholderiaceae bacterium]